MNRLVSYTETSSDDEEVSRSEASSCAFFNQQDFISAEPPHCIPKSQKTSDPITDESDVECFRKDGNSSDSEFDAKYVPSRTKCINFLTSTLSSNESESDDNTFVTPKIENFVPLKTLSHHPAHHVSSSKFTARQKNSLESELPVNSMSQTDHIDTERNVHLLRTETGNNCNISERKSDNKDDQACEIDNPSQSGDEPEKLPVLEISQRKRKLQNESGKDKRLCVPDVIHSMFTDRQIKWIDDPTQHDNRVRSFPHLEGNWATFVHIPVTHDIRFVGFVQDVLQFLRPLSFQVLPDFHVSLSRTVAIRHHWIEPLVESIRQNLKHHKSCIGDIIAVKLFVNDEKTRTFVCLELSQDEEQFQDYVRAVDKSFAEFKLPAYYENPSFHISIGWCLGDVTSRVPQEKLGKLKEMLGEFVATHPDLSVVYVQQIHCQSGNKTFVLTLDD